MGAQVRDLLWSRHRADGVGALREHPSRLAALATVGHQDHGAVHTLLLPIPGARARGSRTLREPEPGVVALFLSLVGGAAALLPTLIAWLFQALSGGGE